VDEDRQGRRGRCSHGLSRSLMYETAPLSTGSYFDLFTEGGIGVAAVVPHIDSGFFSHLLASRA